MNTIKLYPSLIASDLLNLQKTITALEPHCDGFHVDVMDNHFVPNLTWGVDFVNAIARACKKPLFIHLMIDNPLAFIGDMEVKQGSIIAVHASSLDAFKPLKSAIQRLSAKASLAISPKISLESVWPLVQEADEILVMSVEPGFSGQEFLPDALDRVQELKRRMQQSHRVILIAMDGGINERTITPCVQAGATSFAVGSAIFSAEDPLKELETLYALARAA